MTLALSGSTLYVGGQFTQVGADVGALVGLDPTTGSRAWAAPLLWQTPSPNTPRRAASVTKIVPDASRGGFVIGDFTRAGSAEAGGLIHVLADGSLDIAFAPPALGAIADATLGPLGLYTVGAFGCVALDARSGAQLAWGCPSLYSSDPDAAYTAGARTSVAAGHGKIYVAMDVVKDADDSDPSARSALLIVDATTGTLNRELEVHGQLEALRAADDVLYVGGAFNTIDGVARDNLAAIDLNTDTILDLTVQLAAAASSGLEDISAIDVVGSRLFLAGDFSSVGGEARDGFAEVDAASGAVAAFAPALQHQSAANAKCELSPWYCAPRHIDVVNGNIYIAGDFDAAAGAPRAEFAAFDLASGALSSFAPAVNGPVTAIAPVGDAVLVGGTFGIFGGAARDSLAAIDLPTVTLLDFHPAFASSSSTPSVTRAFSAHDAIFVSGEFDHAGVPGSLMPRSYAAAFDSTSGAMLPWAPPAMKEAIDAFGAIGSSLYIACGNRIGNATRPGAAALDIDTGALLPWSPNLTYTGYGFVNQIATTDAGVFLGGSFTAVDGAKRTGFALLDGTTALADAGPTLSNPSSVQVVGTTLFAVDGHGLHRFDLVTGDHRVIPSIARFATDGTTFFALDDNLVLAALDPTTLAPLGWQAQLSQTVNVFFVTPYGLAIGSTGGASITIGGRPFPLPPFALVRSPVPGL